MGSLKMILVICLLHYLVASDECLEITTKIQNITYSHNHIDSVVYTKNSVNNMSQNIGFHLEKYDMNCGFTTKDTFHFELIYELLFLKTSDMNIFYFNFRMRVHFL